MDKPSDAKQYWEDFPAGHVHEFGAKHVTREEVLRFAQEFDPQPFHLDDEAAKSSLFGRLSANGWHTCAMMMRLTVDDDLCHSSRIGSPGVDSLRWLKPVFPDDTLRVRLEVLEARVMTSNPGVGLTRSRWEVLNQDRAVVLRMEGRGMSGRRPGTP